MSYILNIESLLITRTHLRDYIGITYSEKSVGRSAIVGNSSKEPPLTLRLRLDKPSGKYMGHLEQGFARSIMVWKLKP